METQTTSSTSQVSTSEPMYMDTDNNSSNANIDQPKFQQVFEIFSWDNVQRNLELTPPLSSRIPPAANANSAFLDVQKMPTTLDGREVAKALPETAIGVKFRADTKFIQVFFEKEEQANLFINQNYLETDNIRIPILPPKGKLPPRTLLKLDNVPIMGRNVLERKLSEELAKVCCVVEIAPITIKGTRLMTSRWEAIVEAIPNTNLSASLQTIIEIDEQKILISWPGSPPSCLHCLTTGHTRRNCPKRVTATPTATQGKDKGKQKQTYAESVVQPAPKQESSKGKPNKEKTDEIMEELTPQNQETVTETLQPPTQRPITPEHRNAASPIYDADSPFTVQQHDEEETDQQDPNTNQAKRIKTYVSPSGSPSKGQPSGRKNLFSSFSLYGNKAANSANNDQSQ